MAPTERFYKIELLLRQHGTMSFEGLCSALDISSATLKRDLRHLREQLGSNLVYRRAEKLYRLDSGSKDDPEWFSETSIHTLLSIHQLIANLDAKSALARHLQPVARSVEGMLGADTAQAQALLRRVKMMPLALPRNSSPHFSALGSALVLRKRLKLTHLPAGERRAAKGNAVESEVSPQRLVQERSGWQLEAWCHQSNSLRSYALSSIHAVVTLATKARNLSAKELGAESLAK
jgi:predicted DNA-binding transcriptional regulator YafY